MKEILKITSRDNPLIKDTASLLKSSKLRSERGLFVLEGLRLCFDAYLSGIEIESLFFTSNMAAAYSNQLNEIVSSSKSAFEISEHILSKISDTKSPQGIVAVCKEPQTKTTVQNILTEKKYILALEEVQDPGNLGAAARTAEALGFSAIILAGSCCSPFNPKALRASMGAFFRIPVYHINCFSEIAENKGSLNIFAAVPDESAEKITSCDFSKGGILIIGNEGNGIKADTLKMADKLVTIPMNGRAESLSAYASACIIMWEMCRR